MGLETPGDSRVCKPIGYSNRCSPKRVLNQAGRVRSGLGQVAVPTVTHPTQPSGARAQEAVPEAPVPLRGVQEGA